MKTILFYDTETTGIPFFSLPSEDPCQPRITSIAAELCIEETGEPLSSMNILLKPDGWSIPEEIQEMNGITNEKCERFGIPVSVAIPFFMGIWSSSDMRCGHNESFDMRMIRIELMRNKRFFNSEAHDIWKSGRSFCTQSKSVKILNLPPTEKMIAAGKKTPKSPNLGEAYKHFTGFELQNAHTAWADMQACKAVYYGIKKANN